MKTTSISIWYRRKASGVRTTLRNVCGTGEGLLGYELLSGTCEVQERGLWGTNYSPERVRYRRGASGVRTTLRNVFGTGEGPLGYELLSGTCVVQERGLWGTNRTLEHVWYRRRASGVRTALETCSVQEMGLWGTNYTPEHVWYRRGASDVRNAPQNTLGIGKWAIVYRINEKRIPVQGLNFIRLTITILTEIFDNYEELQ